MGFIYGLLIGFVLIFIISVLVRWSEHRCGYKKADFELMKFMYEAAIRNYNKLRELYGEDAVTAKWDGWDSLTIEPDVAGPITIEIVKQRLYREYDLSLLDTRISPNRIRILGEGIQLDLISWIKLHWFLYEEYRKYIADKARKDIAAQLEWEKKVRNWK